MCSPRAEFTWANAPARPPGARSCRGFSLRDGVVAHAVAALFLGALLPAVQQASSRMQHASRQKAATRVAANALSYFAGFDARLPLPAQGVEAGLRWEVVSMGAQPADTPGGRLLDLRITVRDPNTTELLVDLEARRLVFAP